MTCTGMLNESIVLIHVLHMYCDLKYRHATRPEPWSHPWPEFRHATWPRCARHGVVSGWVQYRRGCSVG